MLGSLVCNEGELLSPCCPPCQSLVQFQWESIYHWCQNELKNFHWSSQIPCKLHLKTSILAVGSSGWRAQDLLTTGIMKHQFLSWQQHPVLPLYTFLKYYTLFGLFCTFILYSYFFLGKGLKYFFILYWKDFTSIFQDGDSRPYWVLLPSNIEKWSHLVNLLVRSTCTLDLRMELESSSDTVASKVYVVIWNKVTWWVSLIVLKILFILYLVSKDTF